MPKREGFQRGAEVPETPQEERRDAQAESGFREHTRGLLDEIGRHRGSPEIVPAIYLFLGKKGFKKFDLGRPDTGVVVEANPGYQGVIITVYGQKRRIDVDPRYLEPGG